MTDNPDLRTVESRFDYPFVIKNSIESWKCRKWTVKEWSSFFNRKIIKFRLGPSTNSSKEPVWETNCVFEEGILENLAERIECQEVPLKKPRIDHSESENRLLQHPDDFWCYADYMHLGKLFEDEHIDKDVLDWSCVGLNGQNFDDSTLWIGTKGAHTPCHMDAYGFNIVAQLQGRKKWVIFSPEESCYLYPTRIPYEESSIFSNVNISNPEFSRHNLFKNAHPYVITLEPGDVLYVPSHYWHYVESLSDSISINTWMPIESDNYSRLNESVVRLLMSSFINLTNNKHWLNPTEELCSMSETIEFIRQSLNRIENPELKANKRPKSTAKDKLHLTDDLNIVNIQRLKIYDLYINSNVNEASGNNHEIKNKEIIDCFSDPDVVNLISKKLLRLKYEKENKEI